MPNSVGITMRRRLFVAVCAGVFAVMLLLNCLTPYIADDFTFSYAFDTGLRLQSLPQLLQSLAFHYREWAGRVVVKFFAQGFTMFPKIFFNVLNAAAYLGLGLVIYRLAVGRRSGRWDVVVLCLIQAALWEISPAFGQTNLWMCGSCNYLWASLGILAYLLPWCYFLQKTFVCTPWMAVGMAAAGVLAGWLSENGSAGLLVCLILCLAVLLGQRRRPPLWMWAGLAGTLIGFVLLVTAPGNAVRAEVYVNGLPFLTKYACRFLVCLNMLWKHALPLVLLFVFFYAMLCWQERKAPLWPLILMMGGMGANFAMILSPEYLERSTHSVLCFFTAACASCLVQLRGDTFRKLLTAFAASLGMVCLIHLCWAGYDIASYYVMFQTRDALLRSEIAEMEMPLAETVYTYGIEPYTRWCGAYGLPDVSEKCVDSIELARAKWYGVGALISFQDHTYPFPGKTNAAWELNLKDG